jgi:hypothetical protein
VLLPLHCQFSRLTMAGLLSGIAILLG